MPRATDRLDLVHDPCLTENGIHEPKNWGHDFMGGSKGTPLCCLTKEMKTISLSLDPLVHGLLRVTCWIQMKVDEYLRNALLQDHLCEIALATGFREPSLKKITNTSLLEGSPGEKFPGALDHANPLFQMRMKPGGDLLRLLAPELAKLGRWALAILAPSRHESSKEPKKEIEPSPLLAECRQIYIEKNISMLRGRASSSEDPAAIIEEMAFTLKVFRH